MSKKILKIELLLLFLLTILSFTYFYFGSNLPDNFLKISSDNTSFNLLTFYSSSLIAYTGYFIGPWVFFTFIIYSIFYSILFSQRSFKLDSFSFIFLSFQNIFMFHLFAPTFLGEGLNVIMYGQFTTTTCAAYSFLLTVLFFAICFRQDFFKLSYKSFFKVGLYFKFIFSIIFQFDLSQMVRDLFQAINKKNYFKLSRKLQNDHNFADPQSHLADRGDLSFMTNDTIAKRANVSQESLGSTSEHYDNLPNSKEGIYEKLSGLTTSSNKNLSIKNVEIKDNYFDFVSNIPICSNKTHIKHPDDDYFQDIINRIESKLGEFKIDGKIINVLKGPVVDTYELNLGSGVRISKLITSEKEISMALLGAPIRIVYPMIGRTTIGIEVPRNPREVIYLDEILSSPQFKNNNYHLPIVMGKDAFGQPFIKDLASMPHMLVAGSTGSGKSVFINTVLVSLLIKKSPSQMKLILIDPKQLELALYAKLPHLLLPVVTKPREAAISLLWAVEEMERRYSLLKDLGVRNIEGFNQKIKSAGPDLIAKVKTHYDEADDNRFNLPYIVVIVDEFADLVLSKSGKEIEQNICRLAAKARAAGIHLILATQRPSVDVVTGLIKANFPIRISFKVSSSTDSRTILDTKGAEKLLGKGDMIFKHGTTTGRVHSAYIGEEEIEVIAENLKSIQQTFNDEAMSFLENDGDSDRMSLKIEGGSFNLKGSSGSQDDMFKEAMQVVIEQKTASASMLQRRLRIGYNRAANLIEEMEEKGIVGPAEGSKRRKVLVLSDNIG